MSYEAELDDRDWDNEDDETIYDWVRCADCGDEFADEDELMEHSAVHEDDE
jgi:hypothetical protein